MTIHQWQRDQFIISTDKAKLDLNFIHQFLLTTYWAKERTFKETEMSVHHSYCFGLYDGEKQIGFARLITDFTIISWLADVFVIPDYQKKGLGIWLLETIFSTPELEKVRCLLATHDAHAFYKKVNFIHYDHPEWMMVKRPLPSDIDK